MSVNLDLDDPVLVTCAFLIKNMKASPQTVLTGAVRGGYKGYNNKLPQIEPVEGKEGRKRVQEINVHQLPAKSIILCYEVSYEDPRTAINGHYVDVISRVSIDQRMALSKAKLRELDNEVRRICMIYIDETPGGNWNFIEFAGRTDLTNRKLGIYRYVRDIKLIKLSDYIGHA